MRAVVGKWLAFAALASASIPVTALVAATTVVAATTPPQQQTVNVNEARGGFTNGGDQQIFSTSPTFARFDPALGTLQSTTLSWNLTGTVTGQGNFSANAVLRYAGRSDSTAFEATPGASPISFSGTSTVAGEAGTGTYAPSVLTGTIRDHSGTFPWGATMVVSGTITLTYEYGDPDPVPTWTVPAPIVVGTDPGMSSAVVTYTATPADNGSVVSQGCSPASGATFVVGTTTVNCTATDNAGGTGTASFPVTVVDDENPRVNAPANMVQEANVTGGAVTSYPAPDTSDNVAVQSTNCQPPSGSTFPLGVTTVTCMALDAAGNSGSDTFTVSVVDTVKPALEVPRDLSVPATSAAGATVTYATSATDTADSTVDVTCAPQSGTGFPIGRTTVSCTATDDSGNSLSRAFNVDVVDGAPVLRLPGSNTVEATGTLTTITYAASADDAVDGAVPVACDPLTGSSQPLGIVTVNCEAIDSASNRTAGSFTITIADTTGPTVTVPDDITRDATGPAGAIVTFTAAASDLVDGAVTPTCLPTSGSMFALGTTEVECTGTDQTGNDTTEAFDITVLDATGPTIDTPGDMTVEATGPDGAVGTFTATANDLVDGPVTATCTPPSGSTFALGTTEVECSAADEAGNDMTAAFGVTVVDSTAPSVSVPSNLVLEATSPDGAEASFEVSATDAVDPDVVPICEPPSGSTFPLGSTEVNCGAVDNTGNRGAGEFAVVVQDTTAPTMELPDLQDSASGPDGAVVDFTAFATDLVDENVDVACSPSAGTTFALGVTPVLCTAVDDSGNDVQDEFTVTVLDEGVPLLTLPADRTVEATGPAGTVVSYAVSATDDVDGTVAVTCTPVSGTTFAIGATEVTCHAADSAGHETSGGFTITVVDTAGPVLSLPTAVAAQATGPGGAVVTFTAAAHDAVAGDVPVTCTPPSGSQFAVGATTVTCTATDGTAAPTGFAGQVRRPAQVSPGNVSTGAFVVTVTAVTGQLPATR